MTLLADRGFVREASPQKKHGELTRWLNRQTWNWAIRVKSDFWSLPPTVIRRSNAIGRGLLSTARTGLSSGACAGVKRY